MRVDEIPDYIERNKLFPPLITQTFIRSSLGDINDYLIYRYDTTIDINKLFLDQVSYITHTEYDEKLIFDNDDDIRNLNESHNCYLFDKKLYDLENALVKYILKTNKTLTIKLGVYYRPSLNPPYPTPSKPMFTLNSLGNVYSRFTKDETMILDNHLLIFTNLSSEHYKKVLHPYNQFNYIVNKRCWINSRKKLGEMEYLIDIFSKEGFKYPLCLHQTNQGYYPIACNCRTLSAQYLNLPTIPACIIVSNNKICYNTIL